VLQALAYLLRPSLSKPARGIALYFFEACQ
jgi:hypothetical protein